VKAESLEDIFFDEDTDSQADSDDPFGEEGIVTKIGLAEEEVTRLAEFKRLGVDIRRLNPERKSLLAKFQQLRDKSERSQSPLVTPKPSLSTSRRSV
jgi:hypothetical protein